MVQLNLLPDIKLEYVKASRVKYLLSFVSVVVGGIALTVFLFSLFYVNVVQKKSINDIDADTKERSSELSKVKDLDKMLTVQTQVDTLKTLHENKPVASRLFGFITQVTPVQASLNNLQVDFAANKITLGGRAASLDVVSVYTDTLKATKFTTAADQTKMKAFNNVVLSSFSRDDRGAQFTINIDFDSKLFQQNETVQLLVPKSTPTSEASLFGGNN